MFDFSLEDLIGMISVLSFGLIIVIVISPFFKTSYDRSFFLYIWHTLFCFLYAWYVNEYSGDATSYYFRSQHGNAIFAFGTPAIDFITMPFSYNLGLSFLNTSLVYNIVGCIGLIAFDASLRTAVYKKGRQYHNFATLLILLPSVSFWSSGIGKDAISFLSISLTLWAALDLKKRSILMIPAILLMLIVRPHIAGLILISFSLTIMLNKKIPLLIKVLIGIVSIIALIYTLPYAFKTLGLTGEENQTAISGYIQGRSNYNMEGEGGVDIRNMPLPIQIFTFLFRPLPFEAKSFPAFAASIDNIILMYLFIVGIRKMLQGTYKSMGEHRIFLWFYSIICLLLMSMTTANLGISLRQKWMITPIFIFLMLSIIGKRKIIIQKIK